MNEKYLIVVAILVCALFFTIFIVQCIKRKKEHSHYIENYEGPVNNKLWPSSYYSTPYNYKYGGAWPPGLYSRLHYWTPTFFIGSGLGYSFRPGVGYRRDGWARNLWIRNNNDKYFVSNRDDDSHSALDYTFNNMK